MFAVFQMFESLNHCVSWQNASIIISNGPFSLSLFLRLSVCFLSLNVLRVFAEGGVSRMGRVFIIVEARCTLYIPVSPEMFVLILFAVR